MKVAINSSAVASAFIIMGLISLFAIIALTQLDRVVHGVLYNFGLRFSYQWATPYWTYSGVIVGLSWFNIVASIVLTYYLFRRREPSRSLKVKPREAVEEEDEGQRKLVGCVKPQEHEPPSAPRKVTPQPSGMPIEKPAEQPEELVETQLMVYPELEIKKYDVRHPKDVIDSQC